MEKDQENKTTTGLNKVKDPGKSKKSPRKRITVQGGKPVGRTHLKGDSGDVLRGVFVPDKADEVG